MKEYKRRTTSVEKYKGLKSRNAVPCSSLESFGKKGTDWVEKWNAVKRLQFCSQGFFLQRWSTQCYEKTSTYYFMERKKRTDVSHQCHHQQPNRRCNHFPSCLWFKELEHCLYSCWWFTFWGLSSWKKPCSREMHSSSHSILILFEGSLESPLPDGDTDSSR